MAKLKQPGIGGAPLNSKLPVEPPPPNPFTKGVNPDAGPSGPDQQGSLTPRDRQPDLPQRPEVGMRPLTPPSPEGQLGKLMGGSGGGGGTAPTPPMPMSPSPVGAQPPNPMRLNGPSPSDLLGKAGGLLGGGIGLGGQDGGSAVPTDLLMMLTQLLGNK